MHIIVDSGATKALWILARADQELRRITTPGLSPYYLSDEQIAGYAEDVRRQLDQPIEALHFYGTGCKAEESRRRLSEVFRSVFSTTETIEVETDMLGAARAACGHTAGLVAILGTGSNACRFDGTEIVDTAGGLGFILGDEGSGAALGKALLSAYLNRLLPADLRAALEARQPLSRDSIIEAVYRGATPSRYLATFAPFLHEHQAHPYVTQLLNQEFGRFCERNLLVIDDAETLPVHFIGSVAYHFRPHVEAAVRAAGLTMGSVQEDPMAGLKRYHQA